VSRFLKQDGEWYFVDGQLVAPKTEKRNQPKVGRNDPCPCGSAKKYKKCCGG
jgi:SEC-C motif-containing protein